MFPLNDDDTVSLVFANDLLILYQQCVLYAICYLLLFSVISLLLNFQWTTSSDLDFSLHD